MKLLVCVFDFAVASALLEAQVVVEPVPGQDGITLPGTEIADLSDLAWTGGDRFMAVSDKLRALVPVQLTIDPVSGRIVSGAIGRPILVRTRRNDFEGIAWQPQTKQFFVSTEDSPGIAVFSHRGEWIRDIALPPALLASRPNLSLESVTVSASTGSFWTANEEALPCDGPVSSVQSGTVVRLQEFDADASGAARRQFAWRTEPALVRFHGAGNGVAGLCALPDGRLLVLERGFGLTGLQCRIFLAGFNRATSTSALPSLAGKSPAFASKRLLFHRATGTINYEGMALGPELKNGKRSLILIADSNGGAVHSFLPLTVTVKP